MKNILQKISLLLLITVLLAGCQPDKIEEIGAPRNITSSFAGSWKLTKAVQADEDVKRKGSSFIFNTIDLTTLFPYTDFTLTLNADNTGGPTTFTANAGNSPAIIGLTTGTWAVDDVKAPKAILFKNGATTEQVTLGAYPIGGNHKLAFKVERKDAATGKVMISYTYEFSKQ
jgi:hypothetical protein